MNPYERTRTMVLSMLPKGGTGAEIGVWKGDFSARILEAAAPRVLHLIDPWLATEAEDHAAAWYAAGRGVNMDAVHAAVQTRFAPETEAGRVQIHRAPSADAMSALPDEALDFVYIDGDHAYEGVRQDLALATVKTRPGGLICVDDHSLGKWWEDGVVRAVNECLGAHPRGLMLRFAANSQVVIVKR